MDDFILKNCTFIPELTEGYDKTTGELRVNGGRIAEIAEHIDGSNAEGYDMQGRTVMPGLIDLHTHFVQWSSHSCYEAPVMDPCDVVMKYYKHGMTFMEQGYTTIRDCGSDYRGVNALARALEEGILYGPRVIPCGLIVTPTEVGNDTFSGMYHEADGPEEFKKAAREEFKHGAKFLKIMSSGAFTNKGGIPKQSIIDRDEVQAAVHVAEMKGSYVASHCHSADAIVMAAEEGVRTIEHGSFLDDKGIELLKGNTASYVIPTLSTYAYYETTGGFKAKLKEESFRCLARGCSAGLKYGWGTDIPLDMWLAHPGYEFKMRKQFFGCSNVELLKQATIYSAVASGLDEEIGTLAVGKCADMIAVNGDPSQDLAVMYEKPAHVWRGGKELN